LNVGVADSNEHVEGYRTEECDEYEGGDDGACWVERSKKGSGGRKENDEPMKRMKRLLKTPMMTRVTMSPSADASGVAMLSTEGSSGQFRRWKREAGRRKSGPGFTRKRRQRMTREHMKLPSTPELRLAANMLTHSTSKASKYPPLNAAVSSAPPCNGCCNA
jgi:hypothetical protein